MTGSLLERVKDATNWPDDYLAELLGVSKATVQAYRCGRRIEYLSTGQKGMLLHALQNTAAAVARISDEIELLA